MGDTGSLGDSAFATPTADKSGSLSYTCRTRVGRASPQRSEGERVWSCDQKALNRKQDVTIQAKPQVRSGVLLLLVVAVAVVFRLLTFGPPELNGFDESVYTHYGEVLGRGGIAGVRAVSERWALDETLRLGPLPFRVAFIGTGALVCRLLGDYTPFGFALVSCLGGLALILASLLLARRWLAHPTAVIVAGLLCTVSPLATGLSRRALQDSGFAALVILAFWSLDRFIERRQRLDALVLGIVLFLGFLTKESMLFVYPLLLVLFLAREGHHRREGLGVLLAALAVAPLAALGVMITMAGSFKVLYATYSTYSELQHTIPYAVAYQRGPWFRYVVDFLLISPAVVLLVGVSGMARDIFVKQGRVVLGAVLIAGLVVFACLPLMNLRIVLFLDTPLRILAAGGIVALGCKLGKTPRQGMLISAGLAAIVMLLDLVQFHTFFIRAGVYDPVTVNLVKALEFMP